MIIFFVQNGCDRRKSCCCIIERLTPVLPPLLLLSVIFENLRNIRGSGGGQLGALLDAGEHEWWCPYGIQIEIFKLDGTTSSQGTNSRPHSRKSSSTNGSKHFSHHTKLEVFCCSAIRFVLDSSCHCTFFIFEFLSF